MDREQTDISEGRGVVELGEEGEGIKGRKPQKLLDTDNSMIITRWGEAEEGIGG